MADAPLVALARCPDYDPDRVEAAARSLLDAAGVRPAPGTRVLVKPNLLKAANHGLPCTHPAVVRAVCLHLKDHGAKVLVADSPGFGSAGSVARRIGLAEALRGLDVEVASLGRPTPLALSFGSSVGVSRQALEQDMILNVPRLKAHGQLRITAAVKNLFGTVCGARKALAHTLHGDKDNRFETMLVEIMQAMPPTVSFLDAVTAMHVTGPIHGRPFHLGMLGCSASAVALDTAAYTVLGLAPGRVPLWREAQRRNLPGSVPEQIDYPLERPEAFDAAGFIVPDVLIPVTFHPARLAKSAVKRLFARIL